MNRIVIRFDVILAVPGNLILTFCRTMRPWRPEIAKFVNLEPRDWIWLFNIIYSICILNVLVCNPRHQVAGILIKFSLSAIFLGLKMDSELPERSSLPDIEMKIFDSLFWSCVIFQEWLKNSIYFRFELDMNHRVRNMSRVPEIAQQNRIVEAEMTIWLIIDITDSSIIVALRCDYLGSPISEIPNHGGSAFFFSYKSGRYNTKKNRNARDRDCLSKIPKNPGNL